MAEERPNRRLVVTEVTRGRNGGPGILALGLGAPRAAPAAVGAGRRRQRLRVTRRFHTENYAFIVDDKDVVMWRTNDKNKEATLLAPGFIVDFVGTVSDQSTDGGVNVTTVTHLKVLVVDGARVAPTPKPKKRKKGAEDGDGDDDDEPAAAAKKARVVEGDETDDG